MDPLILDRTLEHHTRRVNAVTLSPDSEFLLSGGMTIFFLGSCHLHTSTGDDAHVVIWNFDTGEKLQVISCAFNGPVASLIWIPHRPGINNGIGFAIGSADGTVHIYQRDQTSVSVRRPLFD